MMHLGVLCYGPSYCWGGGKLRLRKVEHLSRGGLARRSVRISSYLGFLAVSSVGVVMVF